MTRPRFDPIAATGCLVVIVAAALSLLVAVFVVRLIVG